MSNYILNKLVKDIRTAPALVTGAIPMPDRRTIFVSTTGGVQHTYSMQEAATLTPSTSPNVLAQCYQVDSKYLVLIKGVLSDFTELPMGWPKVDKSTFDAQQAALPKRLP